MKIMSKFDFFRNNKGQVSETMTWVVASIIIIFLMVSTIYVSSLLGKNKSVDWDILDKAKEDFWVGQKTSFALEINDNNKDKILDWANESSFDFDEEDENK